MVGKTAPYLQMFRINLLGLVKWTGEFHTNVDFLWQQVVIGRQPDQGAKFFPSSSKLPKQAITMSPTTNIIVCVLHTWQSYPAGDPKMDCPSA